MEEWDFSVSQMIWTIKLKWTVSFNNVHFWLLSLGLIPVKTVLGLELKGHGGDESRGSRCVNVITTVIFDRTVSMESMSL